MDFQSDHYSYWKKIRMSTSPKMSDTFLIILIDLMTDMNGRSIKTQMGTALYELSPFRLWQIALPLASDYGYHGWLLSHFFVLTHSVITLQPIAFGVCLLQLHPPAVPSVFLSVGLPGRSVRENTTWFFTCDLSFCCIEHFGLFSLPAPGIFCETFVSVFPVLNSTFQ